MANSPWSDFIFYTSSYIGHESLVESGALRSLTVFGGLSGSVDKGPWLGGKHLTNWKPSSLLMVVVGSTSDLSPHKGRICRRVRSEVLRVLYGHRPAGRESKL